MNYKSIEEWEFLLVIRCCRQYSSLFKHCSPVVKLLLLFPCLAHSPALVSRRYLPLLLTYPTATAALLVRPTWCQNEFASSLEYLFGLCFLPSSRIDILVAVSLSRCAPGNREKFERHYVVINIALESLLSDGDDGRNTMENERGDLSAVKIHGCWYGWNEISVDWGVCRFLLNQLHKWYSRE